MQMLTKEAAQALIKIKDFTSLEAVPPLPSFDQCLQRLPQQALSKQYTRKKALEVVSNSRNKIH